MTRLVNRPLPSALALSLGLALGACSTMPSNRSANSVHQPVVERSTVALDVTTTSDGLPIAEQRRLAAWFEAMDLRYGDRVSVEDPLTRAETRAAVAQLTGRYGLMLSDGMPVTTGDLQPGQARVVIMRSRASVPGCPDWSATSDANFENGISPNYGCANNSNLAAMVADPEDLIKGRKGSNDTYISTSTATINTYTTTVGKSVGATETLTPGGN